MHLQEILTDRRTIVQGDTYIIPLPV